MWCVILSCHTLLLWCAPLLNFVMAMMCYTRCLAPCRRIAPVGFWDTREGLFGASCCSHHFLSPHYRPFLIRQNSQADPWCLSSNTNLAERDFGFYAWCRIWKESLFHNGERSTAKLTFSLKDYFLRSRAQNVAWIKAPNLYPVSQEYWGLSSLSCLGRNQPCLGWVIHNGSWSPSRASLQLTPPACTALINNDLNRVE